MQQQTLGAMIASLRKERQMTQLELAEQLGVTDKAVSKWERNLSCPDIAGPRRRSSRRKSPGRPPGRPA